MSNHYEALAKAVVKQAAHDTRAQPWKTNIDTRAPASTEEWIEINRTGHRCEVDVRTNAFPNGRVDARANLFPMGAIDVRSNASPMEEVNVLTHAFPVGDVNVMTNSFPI
ncbi:hypothetical protein F5B20DRAFT_558956 [Whalleya microplaca]|nr:hypothetical protein F5B20DRAFT_558956 [Whalleya microplaca]